MNQKQHEQILLSMLNEIKAKGFTILGNNDHRNFLLENKMIQRTQLFDHLGSVRLTYKVTKIGEGLINHILGKQRMEEEKANAE